MHIISSHQGAMAPRRQSSHIKAKASGVWPLEKNLRTNRSPLVSKDGPRPTQQLQIMRSRHDSLHCMWSQIEICRLRNNNAGWGQDLMKMIYTSSVRHSAAMLITQEAATAA
jgi:hypothetical protein